MGNLKDKSSSFAIKTVYRQPSKLSQLTVNLLPWEIVIQQKQSKKVTLIRNVCVIFLGLLVFFTSALFTFRLIQKKDLSQIGNDLALAEGKVSSLNEVERNVVTLKNKMAAIDKILSSDTEAKEMFDMIVSFAPEEISFDEVSVDIHSNLNLSAHSSSLEAVDLFLSNLTGEESSDKIGTIDLDGISNDQYNIYRFNLSIKPKSKK